MTDPTMFLAGVLVGCVIVAIAGVIALRHHVEALHAKYLLERDRRIEAEDQAAHTLDHDVNVVGDWGHPLDMLDLMESKQRHPTAQNPPGGVTNTEGGTP